MAGMIPPQGIDVLQNQGATHRLMDPVKNPAIAELERAGFQSHTPAATAAPKPVASPAGQAAGQWRAAQAAKAARLGMGLGAAGLAVAPSVGGALGYGAGALANGDPVGPAMLEGLQRYGWTNLRGN